jgi:hypothetical protein
MKRITSICFFVIFSLTLNAQSKSPEIFGDALVKNKKLQRTGTVLTVVGGMTLFAGNMIYWKLYNDNGNSEPQKDKVDTSEYMMLGGLGLMVAGIPLFTIGKMRERNIIIEAKLNNYKSLASMQGLGVKVRF